MSLHPCFWVRSATVGLSIAIGSLIAGLAANGARADHGPAPGPAPGVLGPDGNAGGADAGLVGNVYRAPATLYSLGRVPVPPYFSLHPPVYYSYPVPRTYGYSPYAYPGTVMTPEIVSPAAALPIENPHMHNDHMHKDLEGEEVPASPAPRKTNTSPLAGRMIFNPFFADGARVVAERK